MEVAAEDLYDIRREEKMGPSKTGEPTIRRELARALSHGDWLCLRCMRINGPRAKFCTRCGEWRTK